MGRETAHRLDQGRQKGEKHAKREKSAQDSMGAALKNQPENAAACTGAAHVCLGSEWVGQG